MKKISVVLALTLVLVFAFAVNAMAEQTLTIPGANNATTDTAAGNSSYAATPFQGPTSDYNNAFTGALDNTTRIHSNYQLNSNACAACHAIHTGVGAYLLQWTDGQATCEACHDGTSKTYDVFGGQIAQTGKMTYGGRFNAHSSAGGSIHNVEGVDGTVILGAAPGGNRASQTLIADASQYVKDAKNTGNTGDSVMAWGTTFECLSCHDPHGKAGNGRILNPNVNNYSVAYQVKTTTDTASTLYQPDLGVAGVMSAKNANNQFVWMNDGYPFSITVYDAAGKKLTATTPLATGDYTTSNASGFTKIVFTDPAKAPGSHAVYFPGVKVNMTVANYLQSSETVTYNQGIDTFCGACHVDYNTEASTLKVNNTTDSKALYTVADSASRAGSKDQWKVMVGGGAYKILTGTYNAAYRHSVGFTGHAEVDSEYGVKFEHRTAYDATGKAVQLDAFNCLSCHLGHGADETVWSALKTQGGNGYEGYNGSETDTRGSFLTRMPNRGVCQTCHNMKAGNEGAQY